MSMNRREFLKGAAVGGATAVAAAGASSEAQAITLMREPKERPEGALGLLYDSTLCVGCKACVARCKEVNHMPVEIYPDQSEWNSGTWDTAKDLSGKTLNVIKAYMNGTIAEKDRETDGFAFIKRQCLHCVDPSCVSACPVSAMIKDPETGIVSHDPDRCIGCRYCVYACPFGVPKYDFEGAFGQIHKCQLCNHRLPEGKMPGCVDACPTGATLFGRVEDLNKEARQRLSLKAGDAYTYPRGDISGAIERPRSPHEKVISAEYQQEVYGYDGPLGGTQALYLSAVSFNKLGLPHGTDNFGRKIPDHAYARETEGVQHFLYTGMIAPAAVLTALVLMAYRNSEKHTSEAEED
ncbi:MAG: hydrogenase 2 operon protein HybA [Rhodospirillales bacterium]|nr:hydrogenase 2 operon protein HybA [Rhodospirillales bacterium]